MFQCFLAADPVGWVPSKHLAYQVSGLCNILLTIIIVRQDFFEVHRRHVVKSLHELQHRLRNGTAHLFQFSLPRQAKNRHLFNKLAAFRLARKQRLQGHKLGEDAADGPDVYCLSIIRASEDELWCTVIP